VVSATDRTTRFLLIEDENQGRLPRWLRLVARWSCLAKWTPGANGTDEQVVKRKIEGMLARKGVVGLPLDDADGGRMVERVLDELAKSEPVPILPVWYEPSSDTKRRQRIYIRGGRLLPAGSSLADVQRELRRVAAGATAG
jgi:hypothetical protein